MKASIETITPEMAAAWLRSNNLNRKLSERRALMLAEIIEAGDFECNGESIIFDKDGNLLDGQHRLLGCVLADMPIRSVVVRGVQGKTFDTLDTGKGRTGADVLGIEGWEGEAQAAQTLRFISRYNNNTMNQKDSLTNREILQLAERNPTVAESVAFEREIGRKMLLRTGSVAFLHWLLTGVHRRDGEEFLIKLISGEGLKHGSAILTLRERLLEANLYKQKKLREHERLGYAVKAWNRYRTGSGAATANQIAWKAHGKFSQKFPTPV